MNLSGILPTIGYTAVGVVLFIFAYHAAAFIFKKVTKRNISEEIDNHNVSAGIMIGGLFVALAIVISGVIQ